MNSSKKLQPEIITDVKFLHDEKLNHVQQVFLMCLVGVFIL